MAISGYINNRAGVSGGVTVGIGGTSDYNELENKPSINNIEVSGEKTAHDYGIANLTDIPSVPVYRIIKTKLWENSGSSNPSTINLADSVNNYDFILFDVFRTSYNTYHMPAFIYSKEQLTSIINNSQSVFFMGWASNNEFTCYKFTDSENMYKSEEGNNMLLLNIYGVKLGAIV